MNQIKVATWNIGSLTEAKDNETKLLSILAKTDADILCLQEFPDNNDLICKIINTGHYIYHKAIITSPSHVDKKHNMGIALFSRIIPKETVTHKLVKPYESLISFYGQREQLHDKCFLAAVFDDYIIITGHGFPSVRYCSPRIQYKEEIVNEWRNSYVSGSDYEKTFGDLDAWLEEIRSSYPQSAIIIAADLNIDRQLDFLPKSNEHYYDAFEGQITRPPQYNMVGGYKTDAILCPKDLIVHDKTNLKTVLDHNLLSLSFEIPNS